MFWLAPSVRSCCRPLRQPEKPSEGPPFDQGPIAFRVVPIPIVDDQAGGDNALEGVWTIPDSGRVVRTGCVDKHLAVYAQFGADHAEPFLSPDRWLRSASGILPRSPPRVPPVLCTALSGPSILHRARTPCSWTRALAAVRRQPSAAAAAAPRVCARAALSGSSSDLPPCQQLVGSCPRAALFGSSPRLQGGWIGAAWSVREQLSPEAALERSPSQGSEQPVSSSPRHGSLHSGRILSVRAWRNEVPDTAPRPVVLAHGPCTVPAAGASAVRDGRTRAPGAYVALVGPSWPQAGVSEPTARVLTLGRQQTATSSQADAVREVSRLVPEWSH